jgi:hypothetical protein
MTGPSLAASRCTAFFRRLLGIGGTLLLLLSISTSARAERYRTEIVAQVGTVIDGYTIMEIPRDGDRPVINDAGEVVFTARVTGPGGYDDFAVLTNRRMIAKVGDVIGGETITALADESINPKINNQGQVAYSAVFGGVYKVVLNDRIAAEPGMVLSGNVIDRVNNNFKLDNLGRVLFTANAGDSGGVYSQHSLILGPGDEIDGQRILGAGIHAVSPSGEIVFGVIEDSADPFADRGAIATRDKFLLRAGTVVEGDRTIHEITSYWMDDGGRVLTRISTVDLADEIASELYLVPGGPLAHEEVLGQLAADHRLGSNPMPLPGGRFAFTAVVPDERRRSLFADDELLATSGDLLGGRLLDGFDVEGAFDVSGLGNMTMHVEFQDGTRGILAATVVPEPPTLWLALAAGATILACALIRRHAVHCRKWTRGAVARLPN